MKYKKRKLKEKSPDKGTKERWQHSTQQIKIVNNENIVAYSLEESVIDVLFINKIITVDEKDAALKFKEDFLLAGLLPNFISSYNPMARCFSNHNNNKKEQSEKEEIAYKKWRDAMKYMTGAVSGDVESVVCYDVMPKPERVAFLRVGLKKLIKFYGISNLKLNNKINQATAGQVAVGSRVSTQSSSGIGSLH